MRCFYLHYESRIKKMKIFSRYTATGKEWKPCISCDKVFEHGEIKYAIENGNACEVRSFYCRKCMSRYFPKFGYMGETNENTEGQLMVMDVKTGKIVSANKKVNPYLWDDDPEYRIHRFDRLAVLQKFSYNYKRIDKCLI